MKKWISLLLIIVLSCLSTSAFAAYSDVPENAAYIDALNRVGALGIISGNGSGAFNPNGILSREQFAKLIVAASGLQGMANTMKGSTIFPDVDQNGWSTGYINAALSKGFMTGMPDGKFHPADGVTFAQVCTVTVKALGYTDQDVPGLWPKNYVQKASDLGLTAGVGFGYNDALPRWAAIVMIDKLLSTNVKKANPSDPDKTFADASGMTVDKIYSTYSKPEIAKDFSPASERIGSIDLSGNPSIVRNTIDNSSNPPVNNIGESIAINQIKEHDIVYQVSDISGASRYILVVDNKVSGNITGILPNKYSPKTIEIDGKSYDLSTYFDTSKLNSTSGTFNIGGTATICLGYDGKVVDIYSPTSAYNSNYAFVLNYAYTTSTDPADYGTQKYTVKLLFTDGTTGTYVVDNDPSLEKGRLVKYEKNIGQTGSVLGSSQLQKVILEDLPDMVVGSVTVNKDRRMIDSTYVTDNVKIFNLVSTDSSGDDGVNLVDWSDMPSGKLEYGKVKYYNTVGAFGDISVMVTNDILNQEYQLGVVDKIQMAGSRNTSNVFTVMVGGKEYNYNASSMLDINVGQVVKAKLQGSSITELKKMDNGLYYAAPDAISTKVQAIDGKRIKINDRVYLLKDNCIIYYKNPNNIFTVKSTEDISTEKDYGSVSVYLDRPLEYDGKAELILITY